MIAHNSIIQHSHKCPSTDKWLFRMWCISIQWTIIQLQKGNELLIPATIWMNFENMLNERNHTQKPIGMTLFT